MTMNIHFDTGTMSQEEASALAVLLASISGTMLPAKALRDYQRNLYGGTALTAGETKPTLVTAVDPASPNGDYSATAVVEKQEDGTLKVLSVETAAPQRERGKPAPGRARRTKEEIAEDEAADKADAEAAAARGSISTDPENRVGPEDEPETQEQDKADEQAEVEASRDAEAPLTGEDVRSAMGLYVKKFGLPATQEDGASIFLDALGTPPKGAEGWKLSVVSEQDQPTLRKAIDAWTSAANAEARYVAKGGA